MRHNLYFRAGSWEKLKEIVAFRKCRSPSTWVAEVVNKEHVKILKEKLKQAEEQ